MAADNVLKEFLVSLGFAIDESQHKKFQYGLQVSTKEVEKLGLAIGAVSTALAAGMDRIADQFSTLYYTSQLTGATVQNLRDLGFAAGQVGANADVMAQSLRNAHVLLQSPGGEAEIRAFTGYKGAITSSTQAVDILLRHWKTLYDNGQGWLARQQAQILGLNFTALEPYILNLDRANAAVAEHARRWAGINQEKLARDSVELGNAWRSLADEILYWPTQFTAHFIEPLTSGAKWLTGELETIRHDFEGLGESQQDWILGVGGVIATFGAYKVGAATIGGLARAFGLVSTEATAAAAAQTAAGAAATRSVPLVGKLLGTLGSVAMVYGAIQAYQSLNHAFAPDADKKRAEAEKNAPWLKFIPDPAELFGKLFNHHFNQPDSSNIHKESYRVLGGDSGLFHQASYTVGRGAGASGDLQDWLHGSSSFVPVVKIVDDNGGGLGATLASFGFSKGGGGSSSGGLGGAGTPLQGATAGAVPGNRADVAQSLYLHARKPVSAGGLGLDQAHALAILGNAYAESGLNAGAVGDHGTSFGLFQWHNDRATALRNALGARASDPLAQLDYAVQEQMKRDPNWFKQQGSYGALTNSFESGFERPAHVTDRSSYAAAISHVLGSIGSTALGAREMHHHEGARNVTINQGDTNITMHGGDPHHVAAAVGRTHKRTLGDAVRNLAPVVM